MKFILEVDLGGMAEGDIATELGRILRYWGGSMKQVELKPGQGSAIYDSAYREVGRWIVVEPPEGVQPVGSAPA